MDIRHLSRHKHLSGGPGRRNVHLRDRSRNKETNALQVEIAQVDKAMYAYKPYIVQMNKASLRIIGNVDLVASPSKSIYGQDEWLFIGVHTYTQWNEKSPDIGRVYGFSATPFKTQKNEYDAGQFVKFASGSFIKPLRAYLYYDGKPTNYSAGFYGRAASTASINEDLPETMDVVIVERESEEEHTTVIGKFNTRTGEFKMLRNYDLKGRKVNNTNKAHKAYYGKKVLKK